MQHGFCSRMVLWIHSSLTLLPTPRPSTPQGRPPRALAGSQPCSSLGWLQRRPKRQPRTQPWQALCQGHSVGMGTQPACAGHCVRTATCSHASHGLVSLNRETLALQLANSDCAVCNPQPKTPLFPYSTQAGCEACSLTLPQELTSLCHPEQPWPCP